MDLDVLQKLNFKECLELVRVMNASIPDSLYVWDLDEDKVYYTRSISKNYVLQPKESIGFELQELLNLTYPLDRPKIEKKLFRVANGLEQEFEIEYRIINRDGKRIWINNKGQRLTIENGERQIIIGCCATSVFDTRVDKLTGLSYGLDWREDLLNAITEGSQGYLFITDVDDLAAINAQKGRAFGNKVLQEIAKVLEKRMGQWNGIYRLSGDRFAVILQHANHERAQAFYDGVRNDLQRYCTLSVGAAAFNDGEERDMQELLQYAETALVEAKTHGKDMISFFSTEQYNRYLSQINLQD